MDLKRPSRRLSEFRWLSLISPYLLLSCNGGDLAEEREYVEDEAVACLAPLNNADVVDSKATYTQDIVPLFQKSCNMPICHGGGFGTSEGNLWLGPPRQSYSELELDFTHRSLIDVRSHLAHELALVRPFNPEQSFLMLKVAGCFDREEYNCENEFTPSVPCGEIMPLDRDPLTQDELSLLYHWIKNGAPL
jgi:hypothetical protein